MGKLEVDLSRNVRLLVRSLDDLSAAERRRRVDDLLDRCAKAFRRSQPPETIVGEIAELVRRCVVLEERNDEFVVRSVKRLLNALGRDSIWQARWTSSGESMVFFRRFMWALFNLHDDDMARMGAEPFVRAKPMRAIRSWDEGAIASDCPDPDAAAIIVLLDWLRGGDSGRSDARRRFSEFERRFADSGEYEQLRRFHSLLEENGIKDIGALREGGQHESDEPGQTEPYMFVKRGKGWLVNFNFADGPHWFEPRAGMSYIAYLLARPRKPISVLKLERAVSGKPGRIEQSGAVQVKADREALRKIYHEIRDLKAEQKLAKKNHDHAKEQDTNKRIEALSKEVRDVTGPEGRLRGVEKDRKRSHDAVKKAVNRAMECLRDESEELWSHLDSYLSVLNECCYSPPSGTGVIWDVTE